MFVAPLQFVEHINEVYGYKLDKLYLYVGCDNEENCKIY